MFHIDAHFVGRGFDIPFWAVSVQNICIAIRLGRQRHGLPAEHIFVLSCILWKYFPPGPRWLAISYKRLSFLNSRFLQGGTGQQHHSGLASRLPVGLGGLGTWRSHQGHAACCMCNKAPVSVAGVLTLCKHGCNCGSLALQQQGTHSDFHSVRQGSLVTPPCVCERHSCQRLARYSKGCQILTKNSIFF